MLIILSTFFGQCVLGILLVKMVREMTFELMLSGKETTRRGIGENVVWAEGTKMGCKELRDKNGDLMRGG